MIDVEYLARAQEAAATAKGDTAAFLSHFLRGQPRAIDLEEHRAIEALCRKVDIARKVWQSYDEEWKSPRERIELSHDAWPALVCAFLAYAEGLPAGAQSRGKRLKFTNAAFRATDLYRSSGNAKDADALLDWAEGLIERELGR